MGLAYLVDHVESALEHGIKDLRYLTGDVPPQLVDDGCHGAENLGLAGSRDIALVVDQDRIEQRWYKVLPYLESPNRNKVSVVGRELFGFSIQQSGR